MFTPEQMTAIADEYTAATAGFDVEALDEAQKAEWQAINDRWNAFKNEQHPN